jgi:hypothetical protein
MLMAHGGIQMLITVVNGGYLVLLVPVTDLRGIRLAATFLLVD